MKKRFIPHPETWEEVDLSAFEVQDQLDLFADSTCNQSDGEEQSQERLPMNNSAGAR